ncbi:MAG: hypothetical protein IPP32_16835 [Bacteroidetes bacterium]|nr:hypothetical protein [Bacteroidota bacterium]
MIRIYSAFIIAFLCSILFFGLASCSKFDKEEPIPAYIQINAIDLIVPDSLKSLQGSNSSKIVDAWVYLDDRLQGIYELPAKFPVLKDGDYNLRIKAGIKENGIGSTRPIYPFYTEFASSIKLEKEKITSVSPSVYYKSYTNFLWKENFDGITVSLTKRPSSDTSLTLVSNAFDGTNSMAGYLDANHNTFEYASEKAFVLPTNNTSVFLEMNFKTNAPIMVGFIAIVAGVEYPQPVVTLNPTNDDFSILTWNKIYVNLTGTLEYFAAADNFKIYFRVEKPADGTNAEFYLDNIKLVK